MKRVVRGFWGPRKETVAELAVRWTELLTRLGALDGTVFGPWQGLPAPGDAQGGRGGRGGRGGQGGRGGRGGHGGQGGTVPVEQGAIEAYLRRQAGTAPDGDWADRTGHAMSLSTSPGNPARVSVTGTGGGESDHLAMSVVITVTTPDGSDAAPPYAEALRALAETWDVDWGEVTGTALQLALEDAGRAPGEPCVGWAGYLSERRAAALAAATAALESTDADPTAPDPTAPDPTALVPGLTTARTAHGGLLLDAGAGAEVDDLVAFNRWLRATGALEPLPRPMRRAKL
ncbi:hypothetical protein [Streptomyces sp. NPDC047928]|uniref:hypothetical protein n=1 Tax=unclassified Streptomyces TaxID=2593676 RepID=UPI0037233D2A